MRTVKFKIQGSFTKAHRQEATVTLMVPAPADIAKAIKEAADTSSTKVPEFPRARASVRVLREHQSLDIDLTTIFQTVYQREMKERAER